MNLKLCYLTITCLRPTCKQHSRSLQFWAFKHRWWAFSPLQTWTILQSGNSKMPCHHLRGLILASGNRNWEVMRFHTDLIHSQFSNSAGKLITFFHLTTATANDTPIKLSVPNLSLSSSWTISLGRTQTSWQSLLPSSQQQSNSAATYSGLTSQASS